MNREGHFIKFPNKLDTKYFEKLAEESTILRSIRKSIYHDIKNILDFDNIDNFKYNYIKHKNEGIPIKISSIIKSYNHIKLIEKDLQDRGFYVKYEIGIKNMDGKYISKKIDKLENNMAYNVAILLRLPYKHT